MPHPLQHLYDLEINWTIETFFDEGFVAKLGDGTNGYIAERTLPTFDEAAAWLIAEAATQYPHFVPQGERS